MRFDTVDGCPVPAKIAPVVRVLAQESGATLNSCYRGDKAAGLLKRLGKSTQAMLYRGWLRRLPGFNPANPPRQSTHELFSDGVAYQGPRGRILLGQWQVGMDWSDTDAVLRVARAHAWEMFRPYPSGSEYHHLNFRRKPQMPLAKGARGRKVKQLATRLHTIRDRHDKRYLATKPGSVFADGMDRALRRFQADHDLAADGVAGPKTLAAIDRSYAHWKSRR